MANRAGNSEGQQSCNDFISYATNVRVAEKNEIRGMGSSAVEVAVMVEKVKANIQWR